MRRKFLAKLGLGFLAAPVAAKALETPDHTAMTGAQRRVHMPASPNSPTLVSFVERRKRVEATYHYETLTEQIILSAILGFQKLAGLNVVEAWTDRHGVMQLFDDVKPERHYNPGGEPLSTGIGGITISAPGVACPLNVAFDFPEKILVVRGRRA